MSDATLPPSPERWVTRQALADYMGVNVRTVDRMTAAGMPSETWGRRTRRFKASIAMQWAREQDSREDSGDTLEPKRTR